MRTPLPTDLPPSGVSAWRDARTRRALGAYILRSGCLLVAAMALLFAGSLALDDSGDAKPGLPEFLPFILIAPALACALVGVVSLLNATRMAWVLIRHPWRDVTASFEVLEMSSPNGQPVLHLAENGQTWRLTPAAFVWRWGRFASDSQLLLAAAPGRGGVVATPDRSALVWGGRSIITAFLLWRRR